MEQLQLQETYAVTGPQLEILGEVESKLPAPARKKPVAAAFLAAMVLISTLGLGGFKMSGAYRKAYAVYNSANSYNQGIQNDFVTAADAAASMIRQCDGVRSADRVQAAQDALNAWNSRGKNAGPAEEYRLNRDLYLAVELLYNEPMEQPDEAKESSIRQLHSTFASAEATIDRAAANEYNPAAEAYNESAKGFPASIIGSLWGVGELETFSGK